MQYGHFDDKNKEYVITQPDTPLPWINYLGSESFFSLISNTAGGYCFYKDARYRRILRYRYNNVPSDYGGRYLYLRDSQNSEFWAPNWQPIRKKLDNYSCRHGLGYTTINSKYKNIETNIQYFVPLGDNLEIWRCKITNHRESQADLKLFSMVEFCLWDAHDDATNFQRNFNIAQVEIENNTIFHKTEYRERRNHFAFFGCSVPIDGYDTQRDKFLGLYRGWENPIVVEQGKSNNSEAHEWSPIGSHQINLTLKAGESKEIIFLLGYQENLPTEKFDPAESQTINKKEVKKVLEKYFNSQNIDIAFNELKNYWENLLSKYHVETPDEHTNRMVNIWNQYQVMITFNMSRSASYFESGIGRGMGFRDSNQDLLGFVHLIADSARQRILDLAATQLKTGGAYHQYQPLTKKGNDEIGSNFNDDPLWLVLSVSEYLKETGDLSIIDEMVQYENEPGSEKPLLHHLHASLQYTQDRLGQHDLPLIGRADWNDCLNLNCFSDTPNQSFQCTTNKDGKVAESVFIAGQFVLAAKECANIHKQLNSNDKVELYLSWAKKMEESILKNGWDGDWFLRAYDNFGDKVGSKDCKEGQIYIESQGMCIMAGVGEDQNYPQKALASVDKHLATEHGIVLLQPAYSQYYLHLGEVSSYPPGYKENASIFCHTNPWIMIAETKVGNGDKAFDYYTRINPSAREKISDIHYCEPYIYAQTIAGKDAPTFGEAKNSWLTGTAAWNFVAIANWILGVRPTFQGLQVSPVVPKTWKEFKITRVFRDVKYNISVQRVSDGNKVSLKVNGNKIDGDIIPLPDSNEKEVNVEIELH